MVRATLLLLSLLCCWTPSQAKEPPRFISIELESNQVYLNDSVMLHVVSTGLLEELSFEALDALPFDRRETIGSYLRVYEGKITEFATRRIELIPQQTGQFSIGPLTAGTISSETLNLQVLQGTPQAWDMPADAVQLETQLSSSTPYAQQMLVYEATLRHRFPLQVVDFVVPDFAGFRVIADKVEKRIWHDDGWRTVEWRYLLFPEKAGILRITPMEAVGSAARSRWETARFVREDTGFALEVRSPPAVSWWLPATTLTLTDHWSRPLNQLQVGQSVTRSLTVLAEGVSAAQLPEFRMPIIDGAEVRLVNTDRGEQFDGDSLSARLKMEFEVVPQRAGALATAPINLSWWNIAEDKAQSAKVPPRRLLAVLPSRSDLLNAYQSVQSQQPSPAQMLRHVPTVAVALLLVLSLTYLGIRWLQPNVIRRGADKQYRQWRSALKKRDLNFALQVLSGAAQRGQLSEAGQSVRESIAEATLSEQKVPDSRWQDWDTAARNTPLFVRHKAHSTSLPPLWRGKMGDGAPGRRNFEQNSRCFGRLGDLSQSRKNQHLSSP